LIDLHTRFRVMSFCRELIPTVDSIPFQIEFQRARRMHGLCATVARRLGLSHEHVRQVALGNRVSGRVTKALCAEVRRRERVAQKGRAA